MAGVGLYWRFEKWLRRTESRLDSMVRVTGCIAAVRRELLAWARGYQGAVAAVNTSCVPVSVPVSVPRAQ